MDDGFSTSKKYRRSPRSAFNQVVLKNVTVRRKRKEVMQSTFFEKHRQNVSVPESDETYFEYLNRNKGSHFSRATDKFQVSSSNNDDENKQSSCLSKCLFSEKNKRIETSKTCINTIADVHRENVSNEARPVRSCSINIRNSVSDVDSSSCFLPPCSSTKVYKTPVNRSLEQANLDLSGIGKLNSPRKSDCDNEIEIDLRHITDSDNVLKENFENSPDIDDDLPCTQPVSTILLRNVVAFVDVKIGNLQISDSLKQQLRSLGAEVEEKFIKRVTHVIFKDGNLSTYKKAKRWKTPLVNLMWINDCATSLTLLPTTNYVPSGLDKYEAKLVNSVEKDLFDINKRAKVYSANKIKKIKNEMKKLETRNDKKKSFTPCDEGNNPFTPDFDKPFRFNIIEEFINNLDGEVREMINRSESPQSSEDIHIPVPLSLLRKCITPRKAKTDVKQLPSKIGNENLRKSDRRKNLDHLLLPKEDCHANNNNNNELNKENVDSSEEYFVERRSAPGELVTNYKKVIKRNKKDKCNQEMRKTDSNKESDRNYCDFVNGISTQTSKKRQLLPLDQPVNDLISETLNITDDKIPVRNPYESPKRKYRKVIDKKSSKKQFKIPSLRPVVQRLKVIPSKSASDSKDNSDISRRSSSQFFAPKRTVSKIKPMTPTIVCTGLSEKFVSHFSPKKTADQMTPTIVCTGVSDNSEQTVCSIINDLGKYEIEDKVSERTTHVIVEKENFRTINLLKGIVRGCWIVSIEWVYSSLELCKWISEEQFEVTSFSPAVRLNRYDRQSFGPEYSFELFNNCGPIFVNNKCNPPSDDLKELIQLSGGRLVGNPRAAALIVGGRPSLISKVPRVHERWVLDCITKLKILDYEEYLIRSLRLS